MDQRGSKCPKCGGRTVEYDYYLGSGNGEKIRDIACQICGWRQPVKRLEDVFTDAHEYGMEECEECLTLTKKLTDGLCQPCYEREQNMKKIKKKTGFVCKECGEETEHCANGLCRRCYNKLNYEKTRKKNDTDTDRPQKEMKSEMKSEKPTPSVEVDASPGVVFTVPKGTKQPLAEIYIHFFDRDKALLEKLQTEAERNRRTLPNEILYRLDGSGQ